ncbi:ubiquitin-conjugating enzyme E2 T-like [Babylonia areolata]|uniref:ubiquitin-conjugating enzyme E2 T-like n=1 Tax=Babylonia areolata TaxID=304850 RepID=UPI003FD66CC3
MQRLSRVKRELQMLQESPPPGISCYPVADNISQFEAKIVGGEDTPYHGGVYKIHIELSERYPFEPPKVQFITPIYHPNIDNIGRICLDTLKMPPKGAWKPCLNLLTVLTSLQLLMAQPNPDDALMASIAEEFKNTPELFQQKAIQHTRQFAYQEVVQPQAHSNCTSGVRVQNGGPSGSKRPSEDAPAMEDITNKKLKSS